MTNKNVHVFADVPHIIKLAWNHFLNQKVVNYYLKSHKKLLISNIIIWTLYSSRRLILPNRKYTEKNILQQLIKLNKGNDFMLAHKISDWQIYAKGTARMNAWLVANLF